jgi:hypothetical protein
VKVERQVGRVTRLEPRIDAWIEEWEPNAWLFSNNPNGPFSLQSFVLDPYGRHILSTLGNAVEAKDRGVLERFNGTFVFDVEGRRHYVETDLDKLLKFERGYLREYGRSPYVCGSVSPDLKEAA